MPRLALGDGYTLPFATKDQITHPGTGQVLVSGLPVVTGRYRPALPDALAEWRYASERATGGAERVTAAARLVADHLVDWDVTDAGGKAAPVTAETVRLVPEPILNQLLDVVTTWAAKEKALDEGNSPAG